MRHRAAFTAIELLIVITIMMTLMGLTLMVVQMVRTSTYVTKTRAIMQTALTGISMTAMRSGQTIQPVVHPLANSMTVATTGMNRSVFLRGATIGAVNQGDVVLTTGEALTVADITTVQTTQQPRVLLPTDCYCGLGAPSTTDDPLIYGLSRQRLTVLGSGFGLVNFRRLPALAPRFDPNGTGVLQGSPYTGTTNPAYPDMTFLNTSPGDLTDSALFELDQKKAFDIALGPDQADTLVGMGGIITDDQTTTPTALLSYNRLRLCPDVQGESFSSYLEQNSPKSAQVLDTDGNWKPYHLRGPSLVDSWGREILFFKAASGGNVFESAGPDGYFRFTPNSHGVYASAASDASATSPDLDATIDNIVTSGSK